MPVSPHSLSPADRMREALRLARKGLGATSPNPMVGALLLQRGRIIGRGWHHRAGLPHAEIEALRDAQRRGENPQGATLFVTLEPCCTRGRTPPCTDAIVAAGIRKVIVGATDPNPRHAGRAFKILRRAGIEIVHGILDGESARLNEAFNHWIVHRTPFVTVKAAMTLDGKIATAAGESKWITGPAARAEGMKLRQRADAVLVGVNTILFDDPALTVRGIKKPAPLRRIVLDSQARTPLDARVVSDEFAHLTTVVVGPGAPKKRIQALQNKVGIWIAPPAKSSTGNRQSPIPLPWLLRRLGAESIVSLLVEGGGEVNASFLFGGFAHRVAFFYAPKILCGGDARKAVAGAGVLASEGTISLCEVEWKRVGEDLLMTALVAP